MDTSNGPQFVDHLYTIHTHSHKITALYCLYHSKTNNTRHATERINESMRSHMLVFGFINGYMGVIVCLRLSAYMLVYLT